MRTLDEIEVKGEVVLVRVDYNVPLEEGEVASDFRIRASVPTIRELQERGAKKIILISHLGRPKGREEALSLRPVAIRLAEILGDSVDFVDEIVGPAVEEAASAATGILLLENLRFDPREKENSVEFAEEIVRSTGATVFVQDGFAATHRAHTSTVALAKVLPACAGKLVEKEISELRAATENPARPLAVIIGGAKVADKEPLIRKFIGMADIIYIGGKIAADAKEEGRDWLEEPKVYLAEDFDEDAEGAKLDIGPLATGKIAEGIMGAGTVIWNGVLGKVEDPAFATGSEVVAKCLGKHPEVKSIILGGDTAGFVQGLMEEEPELSYGLVSTGGGAALNFILGEEMPGLEVL